ncbi:MAG: hypothetical protein JWO69_521 [Thermoleophilia bacterium]|nr:hypothetical protein [Thermoleophilia bacterium]
MSRLSTGTSRAGRIALGLTIFGFVWIPMALRSGRAAPSGGSPFSSGYAFGHDVVGPLLPWIAAVFISVACIAKERGTYRLWPAYTSLGIITLCFVTAAPTYQKRQEIDAMIRGGSAQIPTLTAKMQRLRAAADACDLQSQDGCTYDDILRMPQLQGLDVRIARNCTVAGQMCIDQDETGRSYLEVLSDPIPVAGILRMEIVFAPDGTPERGICRSMDPAVSVDMARRTCGPNVEVLPAPSVAPRPTVASVPGGLTT